jgi:hypothetical protein
LRTSARIPFQKRPLHSLSAVSITKLAVANSSTDQDSASAAPVAAAPRSSRFSLVNDALMRPRLSTVQSFGFSRSPPLSRSDCKLISTPMSKTSAAVGPAGLAGSKREATP